MTPRPAAWRAAAFPAMLLMAGIAVYFNSLQTPFVYDDYPFILNNEHLRSLWPVWNTVVGTARPVVYLTWALNHAVGGYAPFGYHLINLAIHLLAALVLYGVCRRTLLTAPLRARYGAAASALAFASALLWVVHPLATESVTFIYQRAESLMALWYLLTLYAVIRGAGARSSNRWYAMAIICCALGMASKAIMVTAPLMVLLYDRLFLAGSFRRAWRTRRDLYVGLMATWLLLAWLLIAASKEYHTSAGPGFKEVSPWEYLRTQPGVLRHYLRLAVWPHPLVFDYFGWPVARAAREIVPPLLLVGSLLGLTVAAIRRGRGIGFLGAWFFGILAPTSSAVPIMDLLVEHRMYLPLAGCTTLIVLLIFEGLQRLGGSARLRGVAAALLLAVTVAVFGALTIRRNADYRTHLALWHDVLAKRPENARAYYAIGILLGDDGRFDEAIRYFERAYQIDPRFVISHFNMAVTLSRQKRYAEAHARFEEMLRLRPQDALARYAYGLSLAHADRLDEAIRRFHEALALQPDFPDVQYNLAVALLIQGDRAAAADHFARAMILRNNTPAARDGIAHTVAQLGLTEEVIRQVREHASQ